jgi:hypothetical protein
MLTLMKSFCLSESIRENDLLALMSACVCSVNDDNLFLKFGLGLITMVLILALVVQMVLHLEMSGKLWLGVYVLIFLIGDTIKHGKLLYSSIAFAVLNSFLLSVSLLVTLIAFLAGLADECMLLY